MSVRELRGITPLFQQVITKQAGKVIDAIDEGRLDDAYESIQTLIDSLREEDSEPLLQNDIAHIEAELAKVSKIKSVDLYQTREARNREQRRIYQKNLRLLYRKLMRMLHKQGYLEIRMQPQARGSGRLTPDTVQ